MWWWRHRRRADSPAAPSPPARPQEASEPAEPVRLEITDVLDLHSFAPRDIGTVVEAYLEAARERGYTQIRIIHGKGIGVQRERVRAILRRTPFVIHYEEAPAGAGSWGATVAWLRTGDS